MKLADTGVGEQGQTRSPDTQSVGGVKVAPPYELQPCRQSLVPAHLHLHAEGVELTGQSLQNVLRSLGSCSQGWSEGRREELGEPKTVVHRGTAPPGGSGEAQKLLLSLSGVYLLELMSGEMDSRHLDSRLFL